MSKVRHPAFRKDGMLLLLIFWIPLLYWLGIHGTFGFRTITSAGFFWPTFWTTCGLSLIVALAVSILSIPVAACWRLSSPRTGQVVLVALVLPTFMGLLARNYAWVAIFTHMANSKLPVITSLGVLCLYEVPGVLVVMVLLFLPFAALLQIQSVSALSGIEVDAAMSLGVPRTRAIALLLWGHIRSGFLLSFATVFALSSGYFVTPRMIGGGKSDFLANGIASIALDYGNFSLASDLGAYFLLLLLPITIGALSLYVRHYVGSARLGVGIESVNTGKVWRISLLTITVGLLTLVAVPCLYQLLWAFFGTSTPGVLASPPSIRWFSLLLGSPSWRSAFALSMELSMLTALVATAYLLGTNYIATLRRAKGDGLTYCIFIGAVLIPGVLYGLTLQFFRGTLHLPEFVLLFFGHLAMAFPIAFFIIVAIGRRVPAVLLEAARIQGASHYKIIRLVVIPLLWPALLTCGLFSFTASFDEIVVDLFVINTGHLTVARRLWDGRSVLVEPYPAVVTVLLIGGYLTTVSAFAMGRFSIREARR